MGGGKGGKGKGSKGGCPYCSATVKEENLARHLRTVHPGKVEAVALAKKTEADVRRAKGRTRRSAYGGGFLASKAMIALAVVVVVVAAGAAAYVFLPQFTAPSGPDPDLTKPVTEICYGAEQFAIHRHVLLHIIINNQPATIPQGIGLPRGQAGGLDPAGCVRPLHTHDATGTIHVESKVLRSYTLGEFFQIWALSQPDQNIRFDAHHLLQKDTSNGQGTIEVRVGVPGSDKVVNTFENTVLVDPRSSSSGSIDNHIYIIYTGP